EPPPDDDDPPKPPPVGVYRGTLLDAALGEPMAGARILLTTPDGTELETYSAADGAFTFGELAPGSYRLRVEVDGFEPLEVSEEVTAGEELEATYRIAPEAEAGIIDVTVEGERPPREVTRRTLEQREIARIPGTNGDALRSLQSLPGVARPPGLAGVLLVRGSAPQDTLTFVDGVDVPLIYHFGGLSSVLPTEVLEKIDFYPGNFSARYGRAQGGIVDVGIRSPKDEYSGLAQVDLIDARFLFEGPIPWTDKKWTFSVSGRRSYLDAWLGPVLEAAGTEVAQAPRYYDYQALIERKWDTGKFRVSFYGSDDRLELVLGEPGPGEPALAGNIGLITIFQRGQVGYEQDITPDDRVNLQFAFAHDQLSFGLSTLFFNLDSYQFLGRAEYTRKLGALATLNVGIDVEAGQAEVDARLPPLPRPGQPDNGPFSTGQLTPADVTVDVLRPAAYLEAEITPLSRWRIVPGLRVDYTDDTSQVTASPRLNSRFDVVEGFPRTTVKGGVGVFQQPPQFAQTTPPFGNPDVNSNYAIHYSLGVEQDITRQLEIGVEGFYKQLESQVVAQLSDSGRTSDNVNTGSGYVAGAELLMKYKPDDHFFGWVAYTLSRSIRRNAPGEPEYLVDFDQPHILTILGSYRFDSGWEIGSRFRFVSGNRIDPIVCDATNQQCSDTRINALYNSTGGFTPIQFGGISSERLPPFHALDIRVDRKWQFKHWAFSAYLDVQNAYNNQNIEAISYNFSFTGRTPVAGIPILPSIGLRGEF
ncbi:MAG: TonB-dependent receptor, partial [Myxococcota bacterium]